MSSTFKFQEQSFEIQKEAEIFLEKYLKRIESYAKAHNVQQEIVDDIYQNLLEKLFDIPEPIKQKDLVEIVNTLGEPEDIFENEAVESFNTTSEEAKKTWKNKARFLGVSTWITQRSKIPTRIVRILFITVILFFTAASFLTAITFFSGVGFLIYAGAFIVKLLLKGRKTTRKETAERVKGIFGGIWLFLYGIFSIFKGIIVWGRKLLWTLIRWAIRIGTIIALIMIIFGLCTALALWRSEPEMYNQSLKLLFTGNVLIIFALICLILVSAFWTIAFLSSFSKKPLTNRYVHFWALVIAVFSGIYLISQGINVFIAFEASQRETISKNISFQPTTKNLILDVVEPNSHGRIGGIDVFSSIQEGNEFNIEVKLNYLPLQMGTKEKIEANFLTPTIEQQIDRSYLLERKNNLLFSEKVPYNNPSIQLIITLPKDYTFQTDVNTFCSTRNDIIFYSEAQQTFVCEKDQQIDKIFNELEQERLTKYPALEQPNERKLRNKIRDCLFDNRQLGQNEASAVCQKESSELQRQEAEQTLQSEQINQEALEEQINLEEELAREQRRAELEERIAELERQLGEEIDMN